MDVTASSPVVLDFTESSSRIVLDWTEDGDSVRPTWPDSPSSYHPLLSPPVVMDFSMADSHEALDISAVYPSDLNMEAPAHTSTPHKKAPTLASEAELAMPMATPVAKRLSFAQGMCWSWLIYRKPMYGIQFIWSVLYPNFR